MTQQLLPFDLLHHIIHWSAREDLLSWSLVSWECFTAAGRRLSSTVEVPAVESKYAGFFHRLVSP
jgi:hypothetical protein